MGADTITIRTRYVAPGSGGWATQEAYPVTATGATAKLHGVLLAIGCDPAEFAVGFGLGTKRGGDWCAVYHVPTGYRFAEHGAKVASACDRAIELCERGPARVAAAVASAKAAMGADHGTR